MATFIYYLDFKGPVHFGSHGIGLEEANIGLGSDSLLSALVNSLALLGMADEAIAALQQKEPAFVLSSLFPYGRDDKGKVAHLLPRPLRMPVFLDTSLAKDIKKRRWLTPEEIPVWLEKSPIDKEKAAKLARPDPVFCASDDHDDTGNWWVEELRPRVALDRSSANSAIWWCSAINFAPGCGLYGLLRINDPTWQRPLAEAFALLGDMGLGGERTYGMGEFEIGKMVAMDDVPGFKLLDQMPVNLLLSRYFPAAEELSELGSMLEAWDFVESRGHVVSGRSATSIKRKSLHLMVEGSLSRRALRGAMVDVTPGKASELGLSHRIYRCGLGFWLGKGGEA